MNAQYGLVYALYDKLDPQREVRYVGKTLRPLKARLAQHYTDAFTTKGKRSYCGSWLVSVGRGNVGVFILGRTTREGLGDLERYWISQFKATGRLVNSTDGGDGGAGPRSLETRAKISASLKGRPKSKEHAANAGAARKGKKFTEEQRAKLRDSWRRNPRTHSEETRRKISEGNIRAHARKRAAA